MERTKKFTNIEFRALPRYPNGDLENLAEDFIFLKESQVAKLSEDDSSRYDQHQEEVSYMIQEAMKEFGLGDKA